MIYVTNCRQADNFIELVELKDVIGRPPRSIGLSRDRLRDHASSTAS